MSRHWEWEKTKEGKEVKINVLYRKFQIISPGTQKKERNKKQKKKQWKDKHGHYL